MHKTLPLLAAFFGLAITAASQAQIVLGPGITTPTDSSSGFAAWEYFGTEPQFTGLASQIGINDDGFTVSLSQTATGPGFSGPSLDGLSGRLTTGPYDFSISGVATFSIESIVLQIKHSPFLDLDWERQIAFDVTLDGVSATGVESVDRYASSDGTNTSTGGTGVSFYVYEYRWDNLSIGAGEDFSILFSSLEDQLGFGFSFDTVAITVTPSAVPEPSTYAAICGALVLAGVIARRYRKPSVH
ncbi:glycosyltransferase family 1 [Opitutaceae bacterium TAV5]|nr:glycosyltransferase family 1 [Opitutaceae bacterium TAV5]